MNSAFGAGIVSVSILLLLSVYIIKARLNSKSSQIVSQAMLQYRFSGGNKYSRKLNRKSSIEREKREIIE